MDEKRKLDSTEETENNKKKSDGNFDKLDSLLLDDEEQVTEASSAGDTAKFEAFMAEYRSLMNKNISSNDEETPKENDESEFLISLPKKSGNKKNSKKAKETAEQKSDEKWDDGITLVPEEYPDPGEEDKVLLEKLPEEEHLPDFNLGETAEEMYDIIEAVEPHMPQDKTRYLMGVGTPTNIIEAVARGVDFFDCVMPARNARHARLFTWEGAINLKNAKYATDLNPIDPQCDCPVCRRYSRAYIRHLFAAEEMLAMRLSVMHNLYFYNSLMQKIRDALDNGTFAEFRSEYSEKLARRI